MCNHCVLTTFLAATACPCCARCSPLLLQRSDTHRASDTHFTQQPTRTPCPGRWAVMTPVLCLLLPELVSSQPAIKLKSLGARADGQLEREIEALKMISADCIHLPKVVESGDIYGEAFIVFKAHGIPLLYATNKWNKAERVKRLPLLAHSLTSALTAAHAHGVCHADLRPDNIVVINGVFTLIDFGLSVATGDRILHRRSHSALAY
jgi:serine/threonine protein kinase